MTSERQSHATRPTDLVALVTFNDEVRRNQAVTLDGLADPDRHKARPFNAALAQWLHLGRRMWLDVDGREVRGIATARDLNEKSAWVIDTLIDATEEDGGEEVLTDLLGQVIEASVEAEVTHVLLRTALDASVREAATRAGFRPALTERMWHGVPTAPVREPEMAVRSPESSDGLAIFQLYSRAMPVEARALLGMTLAEWSSVRDRRWLRGGAELVVERDGVISGLAAFNDQRDRVHLELLVAPDDAASARALLAAVLEQVDAGELRSLVPRCAGAVEQVLNGAGLEADNEYVQLCRRTARPVLADAPVRSGIPVPTGGGA